MTGCLGPICTETQRVFSGPTLARMNEGLEVIWQIFVRAVFPLLATLTLSAITPTSLLAVQIPICILGFSFLASFFFIDDISSAPSPMESPPSLLRGVRSTPQTAISAEMPRGFSNLSNNCWLNASLQLIQSDPILSIWARTPPSALETGPAAELQGELCEFFQAYDAAVRENRAISLGFSQRIREALHRVNPAISSNPHASHDLNEAMEILFGLVPEEAKIVLETRNFSQENSYTAHFEIIGEIKLPLPITSSQYNLALEDLLQNFYEESLETPSAYGTTVRRNVFTSLPQTFRICLNRFAYTGSGAIKVTTPVRLPHQLDLPLADGTAQQYRLKAFACHAGNSEGGHYSVYVREGERWYHVDDAVVALQEAVQVDRAVNSGNTYLISYEKS